MEVVGQLHALAALASAKEALCTHWSRESMGSIFGKEFLGLRERKSHSIVWSRTTVPGMLTPYPSHLQTNLLRDCLPRFVL